jgi:dipeptidyl aminopeptidase/acylaminoacyl peptidase
LIDTADEGEDKQKAIDFVNLFNKYYDSRRYAFENYYEWISAPILIQQGTADIWVKVERQETVVNKLKLLNKNVKMQIYNGADHNMNGSWQEAVEMDVEWYNEL